MDLLQQGLALERTAGGWALIDPDGHAVFTATGRDARGQCLREARRRGVMRLTEGAAPWPSRALSADQPARPAIPLARM